MTITRFAAILTLAAALAGTPAHAQDSTDRTTPVAPTAPRPTMTVADFETGRTAWMPPPGLGTTLAELVTDQLVTDGTFAMIDRGWLTASLDDGGRTTLASLLTRASGAHVDYLVLGSVVRLSIEKHTSTSGGVLALPLIGGLVHKQSTETVVGLSIRIVNVQTGEVAATSTAESGASERDGSGGGVAIIGHIPIAGGSGSSAEGFQDRLLDEAVRQAVANAAQEIIAAAPRVIRAAGSGR